MIKKFSRSHRNGSRERFARVFGKGLDLGSGLPDI